MFTPIFSLAVALGVGLVVALAAGTRPGSASPAAPIRGLV
jgi:hypothetical protein